MHNRAKDYYDIMQVMYGHKFTSQFNGMMNLNRIFEIINGALAMLTEDQFQKGMAQLNAKAGSGDFCPTLSDFKAWCMSGSWWTAAEAWQRACDYSNLSDSRIAELSAMKPADFLKQKDKITSMAKKSWDSVYWLVEQGNMREAFKQFRSLYDGYLAKAQILGVRQEWYIPPVMIATALAASVQGNTQLPEQSAEEKSLVEIRIKELQAEGKTLPKAMLGAMQELRSQRAGGVV